MSNLLKMTPFNFIFRILPLFFAIVFFSADALADGTRQASPTNSADGAALLIAPDLSYGSYMGCANDNRIRFTILNAVTENLYLGFQTRTYNNNASTTVSTAYYRIYNAAGTLVAGPTLIPTTGAGFISNYSQAYAGPNIGGATPAGYNPLMFDPTTTGDFYIEIYRSDDGGNTMDASANGRITMPFFDFTVSTAGNTQSIGRVWSRKWSFVTTNLTSGNFEQSIASSFTGNYFAYTPDHFIVQVQFQNGFRPLAYEVAMNFNGVTSTGNFVNDRKSTSAIATLTNGYQVFLTNPDAAAFPTGATGNPAFTSNIYGCPGAYFIPYYVDQTGDVGIVLDLNGTPGYQAGTADLELTAFGVTPGNHIMLWNGLNGLGAAVPVNFSAQVQITLYQGRTNLPMNDAEMNVNGLTILSIFPASGSRKLYWDDTNVAPVGTCGSTADNNNNITTGGVQGTVLASGILGPTHAWNGSNPTTAVPAPASGGGNSTALLCDDYGNSRCINTWFYAVDLSSAVTAMTLPSCDKDGDGIADNVDLDDDNDGVADLVENAGLPDATGDADSDGIPNYLDSDAAGYVDTNFDGVDDRYDFDKDGVINSFDLDSDNDGIPDLIENQQPDTNSDGRIDGFVDRNGNGLSDPVDPACNSSLTFALAGAGTTGTVTNAANAYDNSLTTLATLGAAGAIDIDLGSLIPSGTVITVNLSSAANGTNATGSVLYSTDDVTYTSLSTYSNNVASANGTALTYTLPAAARYIRVTRTANSPRLHAVRYPVCAGVVGTAITPVNTDGTAGPNFLDLDSDNDGITDLIEAGGVDTNGDGTIDVLADSDGDGLMNQYDFTSGGVNIANWDTDGDGIRNYVDLDSDNDGISDVIEAGGIDANGDGRYDGSSDTDNDGLYDAVDGNVGNDATIENTAGALILSGADNNADGRPDSYTRGNSDSDINPNFLDIDSDNDGIVDNSEAQVTNAYIAPSGLDTDMDGLDNAYDTSNGGTALVPVNTDGTDRPDYLDTDSDNDGFSDALEGWDTDGDGTANTLPLGTDSDGDGLDNAYDTNNSAFNPTNGTTPLSYPNVIIPATTERDWREVNAPKVTLSGSTSVAENSGTTVTLTATLSFATSTATTITLTYGGTATNGTDYTASSTTITIPAGSTTGTVTITPINDGIYEGNETAVATITSVTGGNGATIGSPASATVIIVDDETVPTVSISGGTTIAENSPGVVTLTVTLSGPTTAATTVNLGYTGTATAGVDYVTGVSSVTIPAGSTTATLVIDPNDDNIYEGNETVITTITSVSGGNGVTIGSPASTTTTIVDNETVPTVSISGGTSIAENSPGVVTLTVTLSVATTTATTVNLGYTGTATSGTDYVAGVSSVTIPAGSTTATLVIDPNDDNIYEGDETVITTITSISGGNGATIGSPSSTTTTITDNETAPTVSISGGTSIAENSPGVVTLTVTLSVATTTATTVNFGYTGTATSGTDYVAGVASVTIPAGSTTATLVIDPNDDNIYEGDETVITTITSVSGGNGATIGSPSSTTTTITDNETAPTVSISGGTSIAENSPGVVTLTVTLSVATTTATTVNFGYTGTATSGTDYVAGVASVTIPAGSTTATLVIDPNDDNIYEGDETVITTITSVSGGNGATIGSPSSTTTTITDNETAPTVSISGGTTIAENSPGVVTLTVTLSVATTTATTVNLGYTGTATSGTDYVAGVASVTIPAGSTTATLVIDPNDDNIYEGDETVITTITSVSGGNGATIGSPSSTTTTIVDNEAVPKVSISGGTTIAENSPGVVTLTVTLSVATTTATTVNLGYTGTATSGTDYVAGVASVTIPAGSTTATLVIDPNDDNIYEGDETVITTITSVTGGNGATIGTPASTTTTIVDNETVPTVSISGGTSIAENSPGVVTLTVTLSVATTTATTVNLGYTGTATSGTDYVAGVASVTIPAGSTTATLVIDPNDDNIYEGDETVITTITSVTGGNGATIGTPASTTTTIVDNETVPTVTLTGSATVMENSGTAVTLTATLSSPTTVPTVVTLTYTGTATNGTDYTASSTTITIPAGATTGTVTVTPIDDGIYEGTETAIATITNVTGGNGATSNGTQTATVTITDDETVPTVSISGGTSIAENSPGTVTLTVTLSVPTTVATTVNLGYTGTATNGTDYVTGVTSVTIPAGSTTATLVIDPNDDVIYEGDETVITTVVSVSGGNGATIGSPSSTTTTIVDNETAPTVSITGGTTIAENSTGVVTLTVTLSVATTTATTVNLGYTGTATNGTDYVTGAASVTIPAGSTTATLVIDPNDDGIYEGDETVITTITSITGGNGATIGSPASTTTTIVDDETIPTVSISGGTSIMENSTGVVTLTVTLSVPTTVATVVNLGYTGTATNGTDYVTGVSSVTIPAGSTTATLVIDPTDDLVYEGDETVITTITSVSGGNGATIGSPASTTTIIVENDNAIPVANNDNATTNEDVSVVIPAIQSNDTDADGTVLVSTIDLDPATPGQQTTVTNASGTWTVNTTTGDVTFTPAANFNGTATVTYTINDNSGATSNVATITVTVAPVNDAPVVDNENITTAEDTSVSGDLTDAGDYDPDGTPLTANTTPVSGPSNGTIVINPDGTYTYTPNANFNGTDMVVVSICDAGLPLPAICVNDTIFITVTAVNDAPVVDNENMTTAEDTPVSGDLTDAGDYDPDGTPLTANTTPVSGPSNGTIVINPDGTYTYTPNANFNGTDMVVVSICDAGLPLPAICVNDTIFITVTAVNDAPVVDNENMTTAEDTPVSGDLTDAGDYDPDGTPLTANTTPVSGPSNGTIVINPNGTYTYTPNANFNGTDMVVVSVCDAGLPLPAICVNDTIFITITPVNDAPVIDNEHVTSAGGSSVSGDLTDAGDYDPDGTPLTANTTPVSGPSHGTIVINPDGTFTYTPTPGFSGNDMIVVSICDAGLPLPAICVNDTIFVTVSACPSPIDSDGDGLTNCEETTGVDDPSTPAVPNGTSDPNNACSPIGLVTTDTDGDGLTDCEETTGVDDPSTPAIPSGTSNPNDPCDPNPLVDTDGDGLTNCEETTGVDDPSTPAVPNGTSDPNNPCSPIGLVTTDTDGDGLTDCEETTGIDDPSTPAVPNGTSDPNNACSPIGLITTDTDGDGLTDCEETTGVDDPSTPAVPNGTSDPNSACSPIGLITTDTDGDGLTDCEETTGVDDPSTPAVPHGTSDPNNACSPIGLITTDTDGDGLTDCEETTGVDDPSTPATPHGTSDPNNPCSPIGLVTTDTDGDGLTDCEETTGVDDPSTPATPHGTSDPNNPCDPIGLVTTDTDGDGLTDCEETTGVDDPSTPSVPNGTSNPNDPCSPKPCTVVIPEAFTPDGDGINDVFVIKGIDLFPNNTITVFNRWGNIVFSAEKYDNTWRGNSTSKLNVGGDELPTGTYYYLFDTGTTEYGVMKGYVYLKR